MGTDCGKMEKLIKYNMCIQYKSIFLKELSQVT